MRRAGVLALATLLGVVLSARYAHAGKKYN